MGVVIVGPSGAGKSTLWRMLRAALSKTGKVVSNRQTAQLDFHLPVVYNLMHIVHNLIVNIVTLINYLKCSKML